jgi:hypothetical protein
VLAEAFPGRQGAPTMYRSSHPRTPSYSAHIFV